MTVTLPRGVFRLRPLRGLVSVSHYRETDFAEMSPWVGRAGDGEVAQKKLTRSQPSSTLGTPGQTGPAQGPFRPQHPTGGKPIPRLVQRSPGARESFSVGPWDPRINNCRVLSE